MKRIIISGLVILFYGFPALIKGQDILSYIKVKNQKRMQVVQISNNKYLCYKSFSIVVGVLHYDNYTFTTIVKAQNSKFARKKASIRFSYYLRNKIDKITKDEYVLDYIQRLKRKEKLLKQLIEEIKEQMRKEYELEYQIPPFLFNEEKKKMV